MPALPSFSGEGSDQLPRSRPLGRDALGASCEEPGELAVLGREREGGEGRPRAERGFVCCVPPSELGGVRDISHHHLPQDQSECEDIGPVTNFHAGLLLHLPTGEQRLRRTPRLGALVSIALCKE